MGGLSNGPITNPLRPQPYPSNWVVEKTNVARVPSERTQLDHNVGFSSCLIAIVVMTLFSSFQRGGSAVLISSLSLFLCNLAIETPVAMVGSSQSCAEDEFDCNGNGTHCIRISYRCDGTVDCDNLADESDETCGHVPDR